MRIMVLARHFREERPCNLFCMSGSKEVALAMGPYLEAHTHHFLGPRARDTCEAAKGGATPGLNVFTPVVPWVGIRGVISPP
jgi:hypothetical protein